jgi:hypothetical protein
MRTGISDARLEMVSPLPAQHRMHRMRPERMHVLRWLTAPLFILVITACDYDCGVLRHTIATGTVRDASGAALASVEVDLSDNVGPTYRRLSVGVTGATGSGGAPLRGHVIRARLVTESDELLAEIPTDTITLYVDVVVTLNVDLAKRAEYARVRSALVTGRAKVVLETDLAGRERVEALLEDTRDVPGKIERCRYT